MRVLVTGGAGFIGSHIVEAYLDAGHEVLILDDLSSGKQSNIPEGVKLEQLDLNNPEVSQVVASYKPEIINHQAAQIEVRTSVDNPGFDAQVNIIGSINLLEAARKVGTVKKFLFASSGGAAYGDADSIPTTEEYPARPISPYGVAKVSVEHYLHYYHHVYGMPYTALRYANVYGPRQNPHGEAGVVAIFFQRILEGKPFVINGKGEQTRDFVFVKDVVRANMLASESSYVGYVNIATTKETSINQLVQMMADAVEYREPIEHGPAKAGEQMRSCLSYERAKTVLDWQPEVAIEDGIKETAQYFKSMV